MTQSVIERPAISVRPAYGHFIDGKSVPAGSGATIDTFSPRDGSLLTRLARGTEEDVNRAVTSARRAFEGPWSNFTPNERQQLLLRMHDIVEREFDNLALIEAIDMGTPIARIARTRAGILQTIRFFSAEALQVSGQTIENSLPGSLTTMTLKAPLGVIGGIIPWNGPLISQWWILGGALATGCTVVMKPAEDASLTVLRTAELLMEAGLPEGVVNVVTGTGREAGAALASHPGVDRVAFTGSTATGREIIRASAVNMKRLQLELGGKSPDIIFADADLDKAIPGAAMGVFANSGQICFAGTRVFVERGIKDEVHEKMAKFAATLKVGDPLDNDTDLGPIVSEKQLATVRGYIDKGQAEGARLVGSKAAAALPDKGYYVAPTIFGDVTNQMTIAREEIFGPVVSVIPFDTPEEALQLANDTDYGLGGAVWTRDLKKTMQMVHGIRAGQVWVNCYGLIDPTVGFGGYKHSGYGWKGGSDHIEGFLYKKAVTINAG